MELSTNHKASCIKVWGRRSSCNVQKTLWALEELKLTYERIDAGGDFGGLDDPGYLAMNPHGRVPTLVDDDTIVWESEATVRYVAAKYGVEQLWAENPSERAIADQWMAWTATSLYPDWIKLFWKLVRMPAEKRDRDAIAQHLAAAGECFKLLDRHLGSHRFLAGDRFSMADIPAGMTLYRWFEMDIERPVTPNVEAWYSRLLDRSAYRSTVCVPFTDLVGKERF